MKNGFRNKWLDVLLGIALEDCYLLAIRAVVEDVDGSRFEARSNNSVFRRSWI